MNANRHSSRPSTKSNMRVNVIEEVDNSNQNFVLGIQCNDAAENSNDQKSIVSSLIYQSKESN